MAESVVAFLLKKLASLQQEEVELLRGVWGDVEFIIDELERMRAFLRIADTMEEDDEELKVWVKQVRELAYDIEDVLDEFTPRLARHHGDGFYDWLCNISCTIKNLKVRRQIALKTRAIKYKASNIFEGHQRYRYKFNVVEQGGSSSKAQHNTGYERRGDALLVEEAELVGIDKPKGQLIKWLIEGNHGLNVISVVGMGGLGKTTLVKKVYDDVEVNKHFQHHAWITVSQTFSIEELLKDIIKQLFSEIKQKRLPQGFENMKSEKLRTIIKKFLHQRRYVLILDDVWSIDVWEAFRYALPNDDCGSRVVLTTRKADVASNSCLGFHRNVYTLKPLSPEESWALFCRKTFQANSCPPHLEELCLGVLRKCEGLPLAIVAICGVFSTKDASRMDEWEVVHRSLGSELEGNDKLESMKKILSLSYNDLPHYLKSCFLYFCIFPEDELIKRTRLIRLWMAEGFVQENEGKTLEEMAEGYFNELVSRSLIQIAETTRNGRISTCRIHDLLREIALSKSREQNFITISNETRRWPKKIRRLLVSKTSNAPEKKCVAQLRSLFMFAATDLLSKLPMLCGLRLLKVLDLQGQPLEVIPKEIFKLFHLKYLSLRGTQVKKLPSSVGKLRNLETLDLKHAYVTELPVQIVKLQQLRHLLVYRYVKGSSSPFSSTFGFKAPMGMGGLLCLQKLCFVEAGQGIGILRELGRLTQLRRLGIIKLKREDGKSLCSSMEMLSNLRSLDVNSIEEDEAIDLNYVSSPPKFLQRLWLQGRLEKLPQWIPSLHSLVKLRLRWSRLRDDPLESLQALPNLAELQLRQAYDGEGLCFKAGGFQGLKVLHLHQLEGLRCVRVETGAMPLLENLGIFRCKLVEKLPSGIEFLTNLKSLDFADMPNELITKLREGRLEEEYMRIRHIPNVSYTYFENGEWKNHRF